MQSQSKNTGSRFSLTATLTDQFRESFEGHNVWHNVLLLLGVAVIITCFLVPSGTVGNRAYKLGDVVQETLRSDGNYTVIDDASTRLLQDEAIRNIPAVFDYDPSVLTEIVGKIDTFFAAINTLQNQPTTLLETALGNLNAQLQTSLNAETLQQFVKLNKRQLTQEMLSDLVREMLTYRYLVNSPENLPWNSLVGIEVRNIDTADHKHKIVTDLGSITDIQKLRQELPLMIEASLKLLEDRTITAAHADLSNRLLQQILKPNLSFNNQATEDLKRTAAASVKPVTVAVQKGENIAKEGDRLTARQLLIVNGIRKEKREYDPAINFISRMLLVIVFVLTLVLAGEKFLRDFKPTTRDFYLMSALLVTSLLFIEWGQFFAEKLSASFPNILPNAFSYMLPFAAGAMVTQMVLNGSCTVVFSVAMALVVATLFSFDFMVSAYALLSSLFGAIVIQKCQTRTALFKASFLVAAFNLTILIIYGVIAGVQHELKPIFYSLVMMGILSTVLLFVFLSLVTPIVEHFDYITDMKLIELANFNNPLLTKLALEAPGTYHHSRVVAQLVESAAKSIGANPLLAMVSALYHDIGKTKAPQYFTENQDNDTRNAHDKLKPSMSKMIIVSHIKDGIEMGKRAGLPSAIINGIPEHHGTSLITFFYHKAKDMEDPDLDQIDENEYRYPGPKPQSKETALLMLGDSVEAATKALSDPGSEKIQGVIQKIFNKYFSDGQLNECDLTLKDLNLIAKSFHRTLTSVYKPRVEYPEVIPASGGTQKVKKDAGRNNQSSKGAQDRSKDGEDEDAEDLKRLGL